MRIAVIGIGNVGAVLGRRWLEKGHEVCFGVRDPTTHKVLTFLDSISHRASARSLGQAVQDADVVVLATPWSATEEAIHRAGDLNGKILVDCTNPLADGLRGLSVGHTTSAAELVAQWAQGARVVKAFNTTGSKNMDNPVYAEGKVTMFIAGDDHDAKGIVRGLAENLDFEVCDAGPLYASRYLEPLAMLWIHLAYQHGYGPDFAFRLIKR